MQTNVGTWSARGVVALAALAALPVASAHGGSHADPFPPWLALILVGAGVVVAAESLVLDRFLRNWRPTRALAGVFVGTSVAVLGAVGLSQLSAIDGIQASQRLFLASWYQPLALTAGTVVVVGSLVAGRLRWPERPRYAALGILFGLWIAYPAVFERTGEPSSLLGYLIVLGLPLAAGYVLLRDARGGLSFAARSRPARWFGLGTGALVALLFASSMGLFSLVPEHGPDVADGRVVQVLPSTNPLVYWPAVAFDVPGVSLSGILPVGRVVQVVLVAALVGLNAAVLAARWTAESGAETEGRADARLPSRVAAIVPVGCCLGPVVTELVVLAYPSARGAMYAVFVDLASPVGAFSFVAVVALLVGNVVRSSARSG